MGARLIVAPVIAVVPGRSLALYNEEFSFIGEPAPAIRVIRLCVLEVKVSFFVVCPVAVQCGYSVVTIFAAHDFVVGADLILVIPLIPLVQCPGRVRQDKFAGGIIDFLNEDFCFVGHVARSGFAQELIGGIVWMDDNFLAPTDDPVVMLPGFQIVRGRGFQFDDPILALVGLMVVEHALLALPAFKKGVANQVHSVLSIFTAHDLVMGALFIFTFFGVPLLDFKGGVCINQAAGEGVALFPNNGAVPGIVAEQVVFVVFFQRRTENVECHHAAVAQLDQGPALIFRQDVGIVFAIREGDCGAIVGQPNIIGMLPSILNLKIGCLA